MNRVFARIAATAISGLLLHSIAACQIVAPPPKQSSTDLTVPELKYHVEYLASDALEGRGTGSKTIDAAAEYIAREFKRYGLKPAGDKETFFQNFNVITGVELKPGNTITLQSGEWEVAFPVEQTFIPYSFSSSGKAEGSVVFVGYGIEEHGTAIDDYKGIDVKGKIVLVLRGLSDDTSITKQLQGLYNVRRKALLARAAGAVALLVFDPAAKTLPELEYDNSPTDAGIPVLAVGVDVVAGLIGATKETAAAKALELAARSPQERAQSSTASIALQTAVSYIRKNARNVVGMIEGTDATAKQRYLVIGAHYDHLGWGQEGSLYKGETPMIHNGADDNASGTAALMELAQLYAAKKPRHSIVFMAFSGEEMGLLGSMHWVGHPTVVLDSVNAMFNMDMIGRFNDSSKSLNVQGVGTSPIWRPLIEKAKSAHDFNFALIEDGSGASDHAAFYRKNLPVLFFFTQLHTDYHRPSDDADKINYDGQLRVVRFVNDMVNRTDAIDGKIPFTAVKQDSTRQMRRFNVYVGTIPDYGSEAKGFKITGTSPGSPAEKAGLKAGDIIVRFGETDVLSIYDYMNALSKHAPGEDVKVKVKRGEEEVMLTVHLVAK